MPRIDENVLTAQRNAILQLTQRVKSAGHKLYMDYYFSSPFATIVIKNIKQMLQDLGCQVCS